ncbi:cupin domain-containing protein [Rhodococcus sp. ABRD24]|uniref:cupin domain-containing protein n=1 Tax=Rhodococcus sp. ABRD24 TaxID=2507582 RepID=UPI00325A63B4
MSTLFAIATELDLSLDDLLGRTGRSGVSDEAGRPDDLRLPVEKYLAFQSGVRWKNLADVPLDHHLQFLLTEYEPGADSAPEGSPQTHRGDDYGYVLEGRLTIEVNGARHVLGSGESIHLAGAVPHRLRNESADLVKAIWFIAD